MKRPRALFPDWLPGLALLASAGVLILAGCGVTPKGARTPAQPTPELPEPIESMLPRRIEVHPFTQVAVFADGTPGVHARVQARDIAGDTTKAFGEFRFELFAFNKMNQQSKGQRIAQWEVSLAEAAPNQNHWDRNTRSYEFKLGLSQKIPNGQRVILTCVYTSRFTHRITAEREIVAGE